MSDAKFERWLHDHLADNRKPIDETRIVFTHLIRHMMPVRYRDVMRQLGIAAHSELVACIRSGTLAPPRRSGTYEVQWSQLEVEAAKSVRQHFRQIA